jgi:Fe-S-cluster containining protein
MNTPDNNRSSVNRVSFPLDEAVHQWLTPLLDSYYIADKGIDKAISKEQKKGRQLACARGWSSCCKTHKDIPVFPLELVGITWFVTEKTAGEVRQKLKRQLAQHRDIDACSIHPMRPLACRHFNVFGKPCAEGEDAFHSRRQDVLTPISKYQQQALLVTLSFYDNIDSHEQKKLVESGALNKLARAMRDCHWETLPEKMPAFEQK